MPMTRTRTIKRNRKKKDPALPFLPESLQAFLARRFIDLVALSLVFVAFFLAGVLVTYDHSDPSWNTAVPELDSGHISNIGGLFGAWIADVLLQTLGAGAYVLATAFLFWGIRVFRRESIRPLSFRIISVLFSSVMVSIALSMVPSGNWTVHPYLGSSAGTLLLNSFTSFSEAYGLSYGRHAFVLLSGFLGFIVFLYGIAFTKDEISYAVFRSKVFCYRVFVLASAAAQGFYNWLLHFNDPSYEPEPIFGKLFDKFRREDEEEAENAIKPLSGSRKSVSRITKKIETDSNEDVEETEEDENEETVDHEEEDEESEEEEVVVTAKRLGLPSIPVLKPSNQKTKTSPKNQIPTQQSFALADGAEWILPDVALIQAVPKEASRPTLNEDALRRNAELLQNVLADFNVNGEIVSISPGPVVTLYELEPAPGTKTSRVISLSDDIARSMSAISVRCAVVPGRNVIGIELPNKERQTVYMREMLESRLFEKTSAKLPLILGKDIGGQPILADLAKMPHLLVAGTTGSGKSVAVNTMIMSLLFRLSPEQCRFIMIDPKMLELSVYDGIPHLLSPVVTEPGKAIVALKWAVREMETRYRNMSKLGVRNIEGYNQRIREAIKKGEQILHKVQTGFDPDTGDAIFEDHPLALNELPYIVIIVDEFADLMLVAGKDVENAIQRLAQMARAAGLHLIMATQRPSVDVITGVIKANFPTRISFQVTSKIDSRTILGDSGAEQLLGMGDMLYMAPGGRVTRVHGPFVDDRDVEKTTTFLKSQATPAYLDNITEDGDFGDSEVMSAMFGGGSGDDTEKVDDLYDRAVAVVAREGKVSTSFIQRHLQIGYNRAARIVEEMERQGIISAANAVGKRQILVRDFSDV